MSLLVLLIGIFCQSLNMRESDVPHQVTVAQVATTSWTHVCTTGTITQRTKEADGDWHLKIQDGDAWFVAEIIPQIPIVPPKRGIRVTVCGITRYDKRHKWPEIHPVTSLRQN